MTLLSSATNASRVVRNVGRMREILSAMTRFGFGTLVERSGLGRFRLRGLEHERVARAGIPERLRMLFEELGPSFIKIGQILAGRPDLIPAELVAEFSKLQDQVAPVPFSVLKGVVEAELGRSLDQCFASFDTEALASASIAQVHAARTLDGDDVVVKIQKPDVQKYLSQDLEILEMLGATLERTIPEIRPFRIRVILKEFKRSLMAELSFTREAQNIRRYRENFAESAFIVIPKVYLDLSSERVLTLERLRGVKMSNLEGVRNLGVDPKELLAQGLDAFYQSILIDGFFHGDPHGGNIFVLPDGRMGLIDFGAVGWLSDKAKGSLINMFLALLAKDFDALVQEYMWLSPAASGSRTSNKLEALQAEVSTLMAPLYGVPIKDIPAGKVLMECTSVAFRYDISLPRDLVMVFKAIMTLEGMGRQLDPNFDLLGAAARFSPQVLSKQYDPAKIGKELLFVVKDASRFLQHAPRQLGEALRQIESGDLKLNHRILGLTALSKAHLQASSKIAYAILTVGLLLTTAMTTANNVLPIWATITLWTFSALATSVGFFRTFRA